MPAAAISAVRLAPRWRAPTPLAQAIAFALGGAALVATAIIARTGMAIEWQGFARFGALVAVMGGASLWSHLRFDDRRLAAAAGIVGAASLSLMICGVISNAGLRLGAPLADAQLATADAAIGIDAGAMIRAIAHNSPLTAALNLVYNASGMVVVGLIGWAIARGRIAAAWELATTAIIAMQLVALASPAFPAWGAMQQFALGGLQGQGLPHGAGVYQWPAFVHFRYGTDTVLRLADMGGVVAFPSFHTVLGLIIAQALANGPARWLGVIAAATVAVAAIPMGGHYAVDLIGGLAIWLAAAAIARRVSIPSA
jgi:hypothetical protein